MLQPLGENGWRMFGMMVAGIVGEEVIPAEIANRVIGGENKVRAWRDYRGMSTGELAATVGVSPTRISEIEGGKNEGSVSVLKKIAEALRVDLDDLV